MKFIAAVLFLVSLSAGAQTAKVIALSPTDTAEAKQLVDRQNILDEETRQFRAHITKTYLVTTDSSKGNTYWSDPDNKGSGIIGLIASSSFVTGNLISYTCTGCFGTVHTSETSEEKTARRALQKKEEKELAEYNAAHPIKYLKVGWDNPGYFQYSDDFMYIVPATPIQGSSITLNPSWMATAVTH